MKWMLYGYLYSKSVMCQTMETEILPKCFYKKWESYQVT